MPKANECFTFGSLYTVIWKILRQAKNPQGWNLGRPRQAYPKNRVGKSFPGPKSLIQRNTAPTGESSKEERV